MRTQIVKYEIYPKENPTSYAVGFEISLESGRSFYMDTLVDIGDIESGMVDGQIAELAFNQIELDIMAKVEELAYTQSTIIGKEFIMGAEYESTASELRSDVDGLVEIIDAMIEI